MAIQTTTTGAGRELKGSTSGFDLLQRAQVTGMGFACPVVQKQSELAAWLHQHLGSTVGPRAKAAVESVFARSPIEQRPIGLLDPRYADIGPRSGQPWSVGDAMRMYEAVACTSAHQSARAALTNANLLRDQVTDLVFVSSTGVSLPGPEVTLIHDLGLRPSVNRKSLSGMGCSGAFYGLETARTITAADPSAIVLLVCVEVCSAHLQSDPRRQSIVAHSLFGDAAASLVVRRSQDEQEVIAEVGPLESVVAPEHRDLIRWDLDRDGYRITLSPRLPVVVGRVVGNFVKPLIEQAGQAGGAAGGQSWSVHPGGTAILDKVEAALDLPPSALASSRALFTQRGNLSSPAVLFVLAAERNRHASGTTGIMLGFGPGLALAGATYRMGGREAPLPFQGP